MPKKLNHTPVKSLANPGQFQAHHDNLLEQKIRWLKRSVNNLSGKLVKPRIASDLFPGKKKPVSQRKVQNITSNHKQHLRPNSRKDQPTPKKPQKLYQHRPGALKAVSQRIQWVTKESSRVADKAAVNEGPLGQSIQLLKNQAFTQDNTADSRSSVTQLFDSFEGQSLFSTGDHWLAPAVSRQYQALLGDISMEDRGVVFNYRKNEPKNKFDAVKTGANDVPVDRQSTLAFIELFIKAVKQEKKPGGTESPSQAKKKQERLQALTVIHHFVTSLKGSDPDCAALCRLALQLCGRCRERSLVRQQSLPLCGGFAALQAAWGQSPLKMTRLALRLACDYKAKTGILKRKYLKLPQGINFSNYTEALADKLLLSVFFDLNKANGSNTFENAQCALALDLAVQLTDIKNKPSDSDFIPAIQKAVSNKAAVSLTLDGKLTDFLEKNWTQSTSRKRNDQPWNIDTSFQLFKTSNTIKHGVIMDSCYTSRDGEDITVKIQSWGRVMWLTMKTMTFLNHIAKEGTIIFHKNSKSLKGKGVFKKPDKEHMYLNSDNHLVLLDMYSGKEQVLAPGESAQGPSGTIYRYDGNGHCTPFSPPK